MTKGQRLNEIVKCCEIRFNRGEVSNWKHGDFVDLQWEILRESNINISPSTLKRIFGKIAVDDDYIPQQATLDALIKYGKYIEPANLTPSLSPAEQPNKINKTHSYKRLKLLLILLTTVIVITAVTAWWFLTPRKITGTIRIVRTEGRLPSTTFFDLQLSNTDDSVFVNFGDKSPMVHIKPGEKNAAHIYYIPGVFTVSLQTRQDIIATTSIYIQSNNWIGMGFHNQEEIPDNFYKFPAFKSGTDSLFEFTNSQLSKTGLDTAGVILTRLCNYTPYTQNADNFIFEATFKNTLREKGDYCTGTHFQISGSNSLIKFKLAGPGCSLRVSNVLSEKSYTWASNDLSQFVHDLSKWNTIKLINHNKQVSLYINNMQIFAGSYQRPLGEIRGLFLEFEGTGLVKICDLKSFEGKLLYHF